MVKSYLRYTLDDTLGLIASPTSSAVVDPSGNYAIVGTLESVSVWNVRTGEREGIFQERRPGGGEASVSFPRVTRVVAPRDNLTIIAGYKDGTIRIWSVETREVLVTLKGHKSAVTSLCLSGDGLVLASGSDDTDVVVWDLVERSGLYRLQGHKGPITDLHVCDRRRLVISSSKDSFIRVWDMDTHHCAQMIANPLSSEVWSFDVDAEETRLVAGDSGANLRMFQFVSPRRRNGGGGGGGGGGSGDDLAGDSNEGNLLEFVQHVPRKITTGRAMVVRYSPGGDKLACVVKDKFVEFWSVSSAKDTAARVKKRCQRQRKKLKARAAALPPDQREEFMAREGQHIVNDVRPGDELQRFANISSQVSLSSFCFFPDGERVLISTPSNSLYVYRVKETKRTIVGPSAVHARAMQDAEALLDSGVKEKPLTTTTTTTTTIANKRKESQSKKASSKQRKKKRAKQTPHGDGGPVVVNGDAPSHTNTVVEYHHEWMPMGAVRLQGHRHGVRAVALSDDDVYLLSCSAGEIKVWNIFTGRCVTGAASGHGLCGIFVPGGKHAVVGTKEGTLQVFELRSATLLCTIEAHTGPVYALSLLPDKSGVASASADGTFKTWEFVLGGDRNGDDDDDDDDVGATTTTLGLRREDHTELSMAEDIMAMVHTQDYIALALLDFTVMIYFADSHKFYLRLYGHRLPVLSLDVSSDQQLCVTGSADKNIRIWGMDFGDCHKSIFAHDDSVLQVKFVAHTHYFFSSSRDGTVKYWDADKFEHIMTLDAHYGQVWALCLSSLGGTLVSAGQDCSLRCWRRTDEQLFLEEERLLEREAMYDRSADTPLERSGGDEASKSATELRSLETLKSGEKVLEAVERARKEHMKDVTFAKMQRTVASFSAFGAMGSIEPHEKSVSEASGAHVDHHHGNAAGGAHRPEADPLLMGKSPSEFLLEVLRGVPVHQLEAALEVLPFDDTVYLLEQLNGWLEKGRSVELCNKCVYALLSIHHAQMASQRIRPDLLEKLTHSCRSQLVREKDIIGFNSAGLGSLKALLESKRISVFDGRDVRRKLKRAAEIQSMTPREREEVLSKERSKKKAKGIAILTRDSQVDSATNRLGGW